MITYLAVRFGLATLLVVPGVRDVGWRIEVIAWLAFGLYAIVLSSRWAFSKIRS